MIVNNSGLTLTPRQFKAAIRALGLSQARAAMLCGCIPGLQRNGPAAAARSLHRSALFFGCYFPAS